MKQIFLHASLALVSTAQGRSADAERLFGRRLVRRVDGSRWMRTD